MGRKVFVMEIVTAITGAVGACLAWGGKELFSQGKKISAIETELKETVKKADLLETKIELLEAINKIKNTP